MRKFTLAALGLLMALPAVGLARSIELPANAVGVNEDDFKNLDSARCYTENAPNTAQRSEVTDVLCDPLLAQLEGKVIFRADHNGEQYKVNIVDDAASLERYLPDGFYQAQDNLYWVSNGHRVRVNKTDNGYNRIMLIAQNDTSYVTYAKADQLHNVPEGRIAVVVDRDGQLAYVGENGQYTMLEPKVDLAMQIGNNVIHIQSNVIKELPVNNAWK